MALRFEQVRAGSLSDAQPPGQVEGNPVALRRDVVAVEQQRAALVGDDHIEHAAVAEVAERDGAAVVAIGDADHRRDVD